MTRSVAFDNGKNGFTWNSNPGAIRLSNALAFDNTDGDYRFGDDSPPTQAGFTNNASIWTKSEISRRPSSNAGQTAVRNGAE